MEYTVNKLAKLSGVTTRTLRYYDEIGLLSPERTGSNGYRIYGPAQVDALQQILFYRELGLGLDEIKTIIKSRDFDKSSTLRSHLASLLERKAQIEILIENVKKSIGTLEGETVMTDKEKFEGFKKKLINDNEAVYGKEVRAKYGNEAADASNLKLAGMSEEQWKMQQDMEKRFSETLKNAMKTGDPSGKLALKACDEHRQWLCMFWKDGAYSKEAHRGLAEMYVADERFKAYYDKIAPRAAEFFKKAIDFYCG
ncbi:MAG: MerR family transcriptional regulator [Oscillospiraceae bacterium]